MPPEPDLSSKPAAPGGIQTLLHLAGGAFWDMNARKASIHAAALAYATLFSLAPLLIISVTVAAFLNNEATFQARLLRTIANHVGQGAADLTSEILATSYVLRPNSLATLVSLGLLLFGASRVFLQLRSALNAMWDVDLAAPTLTRSLAGMVRNYLTSALIALGVGLAPVLLLFVSALAAALPEQLRQLWGAGWLNLLITVFSSPVIYFVLFAMIFKWLPQAAAPWRAVIPGAVATALLYWIGNAILAWYVQSTGIQSLYGAAGSAIALLIWTYYSAFIVMYGARFIRVFADLRRYAIVPHQDAAFVETVAKMRQ